MMLAVLSRRYLFLSSVLGSLLVFFLLWGGYQKRDSFPKIGWPTSIPYASGGSSWAFDARRDATNYGLTEEQCEIAFPGLFEEPRQAAEHVRSSKKGRITPEDIDLSWKKNQILRAMIYDRELYIIDAKRVDWTRERSLSVLGQIYRAVTAYSGDLPNVEFTIAVDDGAWGDGDDNWPIWSFTRTQDKHRHWVMPGFGFWAWSEPQIGSYNEIRRKVRESEPAFEEKIPKAIWRGAPGLHPSRQKLLEYSENKPWADIKPIVWSTQESIIPMVDHCKYQFVVHTEGAANSARLIYLHNCHSVVIVPELHWLEPHLGLFKTDGPDQNVVLCKKDFSDIDEKMQDLLQNPEKARRIADNNAAAFRDRYMTPAAISCYWRAMFRAWASVSFEPQLYGMVNVTDPDTCQSHEQIGWRGQSWEKYMFSQVLYGKDKCTTKEQRIKDEEKKKEEEERKKKEKEEADRKKKLEEAH